MLISGAHADCRVVDDKGAFIHLQNPAQRIISLAPDITEILFKVGAGKQVAGVIQGSDYPQEARHITPVGSYTGIDLEKIISLHPDLVVTWGNTFSRQIEALRKFAIPVYVSEPEQLDDIPRTMNNLGCLTGNRAISHREAEYFSRQLERLTIKYRDKQQIKVFYQIGSYSLFTVNKSSWINQVIRLCGGMNVFAEARLPAAEVSWEAVVTASPQVIISDAEDANWKARWLQWRSIPAVRNNYLFSINPDLIERASPRLLEGAEQMCQMIEAVRKR